MELKSRPFAGLPVTYATQKEVTAGLLEEAQSGRGCDVHLLESNGVAAAQRDPAFADLLASACLVIPDGRWLELLTRNSIRPLHQFRGEDLFRTLCDRGREFGLRHFFVGSTPEKIQRLVSALEKLYPGVAIAGSYCPPFRPLTAEESSGLSKDIATARPNIVWMGISTPLQDFEARRLAQECGVVVIAVGAAFEFVSGDKKKAPAWMSHLGIEWLFRLLSEPRRLAKRYVVGNVLFLWRFVRFLRQDTKALAASPES
jgi:N-acetylglucosaminyldiphosphoundecaprenol N-acetyl-beta-D-mannosaminyltransferase